MATIENYEKLMKRNNIFQKNIYEQKKTYVFFRPIFETMIKLKVFIEVKKWWLLICDYFGLLHHDYKVAFNRGFSLYIRGGTTDKHSIHEVILRDDYGLRDIPKYITGPMIDLGANAGIWSVYAAMTHPKVKVFAYEPIRSNIAYLKKNVKLNKLERRIEIVSKACCAFNGKSIMYLSKDHRAHSLVQGVKREKNEVKCVTLSRIFKDHRIKKCLLLKMDVEGAEYEIISKTQKSLFKNIVQISLEYHNEKIPKRNGKYLAALLEKYSFFVTLKEFPDSNVGLILARNTLHHL